MSLVEEKSSVDPKPHTFEALPGLTRDEDLLASLGYKQELKRSFSPWELFGIAFSFIGLFPSIAYVHSVIVTPALEWRLLPKRFNET